MDVREATPDDVEAVAGLFGTSANAAERILLERDVVVAEDGAGGVVGACAYDRWQDVVQVTRLETTADVVHPLLEPAVDRARSGACAVEILVVDESFVDELEAAGFTDAGPGPRFEGQDTRTYRREP